MASVDASDPLVVFGALAALILLGFIGNLIFSRLRFNDTLILIAVGVLVGPIFGLVDQDAMLALSSIVGPLALILILFDGGLALKFQELAHGLGNAALLGFLSFVGTFVIVGGLTAATLGLPMTTGLILGAILGGTSALVVLPSLEHMDVKKKTGITLGLESALTDVLVVVVSFTMISIVAAGAGGGLDLGFGDNGTANGTVIDAEGPSIDAQSITSKLLITFAMSIFMGVAAGILWLLLYPRVRDKPFGYMLTLGFMFFVYVLVEWVLSDVSQGGGPLAVLAFGIILGNSNSLGAFGRRVGDDYGSTMKRFQGEISFLVRTFFFVFLGIIVDLSILADFKIIGIGILLFVGMLAARYLAVVATSRRLRPEGDDWVLIVMMPRGLAAAVLAAEPFAQGIPGTASFVALAFLLLVGTNVLSTVGALVLEKKGKADPPAKAPAKKTASKSTTKKAPAKNTASKSTKAPAKKSKQTSLKKNSTEEALEALSKRFDDKKGKK